MEVVTSTYYRSLVIIEESHGIIDLQDYSSTEFRSMIMILGLWHWIPGCGSTEFKYDSGF